MHRPLKKSSLILSPQSDGYVVYDVELNRLHELNPTASLLLELCDGRRSVEEIIELASDCFPSNSVTAVTDWFVQANDVGLTIDSSKESHEAPAELVTEDLIRLAETLREEGLIQAAYICQEYVVTETPDDPEQLRELGELAHIVGKRDKALDAYDRYLQFAPDDAEVRHLLTSLRDERAPARVPDGCIRQLYERFASFYESNMCEELGYEGPQHLTALIDESLGERGDLNVLDLGCGTGLSGAAIHGRARHLVGVDLSDHMIDQARARGIYDELHTAELTQWLEESNTQFDLIIACDTLIYFGDLTPVLRLASARLAPDGVIAFSVENADSGQYQLTDNGRYVHHRSHLEATAHDVGLTILRDREEFIRMEYGAPVQGLYICLSRSLEATALVGGGHRDVQGLADVSQES